MSHLPPATKVSKRLEQKTPRAPFAGPRGIVRRPPNYGIDFVDRAADGKGPLQLMPQPDRRPGGEEMAPIVSRDRSPWTPNRTGLPRHLKASIENLSGFDMSDVRVHYNSSKPAALQALAYTQGTDIHVAAGQERHLPHEAWHVVQQKQGRVLPTMQLKGSMPVNDNQGLEHEADVMGGKAMCGQHTQGPEEVGEGAAQPLVDLRTLSITFPMDADGDGEREEKRLFFQDNGLGAILMINPDPQPLEKFLKKYGKYKDQQVTKMVGELHALMTKSGGISQVNGATIAKYMRWIASYLVNLHNREYKAQKPPTVAHWTPTLLMYQPTKGHTISETVTKKLTVSPLSIIPPTTGEYGTKVQNSATSYMQELRRWGSYIRGHMLNSKIHGPGEDKNLVPISSTFNKEMEGGIEKTIKDEVIARNKVVFYEIEPINWGQYKGSGYNPHRPNAEEQLPKDFKITLKPMKLKHPGDDGTDFKNWEINPKKSALFDKSVPHSVPGTTYYNPNAKPIEIEPGVYELVTGQWWPNPTQLDVWTVDGVIRKKEYTGYARDTSPRTDTGDHPQNFRAKHYKGIPTKLELINDQLVVTCADAAMDQIKARLADNLKRIEILSSAVNRVEAEWGNRSHAELAIEQRVTDLTEANIMRLLEYYGAVPEQEQKYAEAERPISEAHDQRAKHLHGIRAEMDQLRNEIAGTQKEEQQFWQDQQTLATGDEQAFWKAYAMRKTHTKGFQDWHRSSTEKRGAMENVLKKMSEIQSGVVVRIDYLNVTLGQGHNATLRSHAQAITNAKSDAESKAKSELKRQDKLKQQNQANFLTPPLGAELPSRFVPPLIPRTKMEIEPKPQVGLPLSGADILEMARTILDELTLEGFKTETQSHGFKQQIEQEYMQGDLRKEYPLLGSWPESRRSEIKDKIYTVIAQKMETSIIQAIQHETSVSKQSIISETVSNPVGPSHADFLSMPSLHNLGVNLPSFGAPPVPVINLNEPEQPMEISSRASGGRRPPPRMVPSTELNRDAVIYEAKKIVRTKRKLVPYNNIEVYDRDVREYLESLQKTLPNKTWEMTEKTAVLKPIYDEILKIAKQHGYRDPKK